MAVPLDMDSVKELKQKIKLARNKELSFALALGKKPEDCALIMHKERGGDKLLLQVKKIEGVQPQKSCYGSLTVDGQLVKLACRTDPPAGLVKNFRIFFRSNGIQMKLAVQAPGETEFKLDAEDAAEVESAPAGQAAAGSGGAQDEPAAQGQAADQAEDQTENQPEPVQSRLSEAETQALQARIDAVKDALGGLEGAILDKIAEGHRRAQMLLVKGNGDRAMATKLAKLLDQLEAALQQIAKSAAQKSAPQAATEAATEPSQDFAAAADPAQERWQATSAKLEPHVRRVLAAGHGDTARIQTIWSYAQDKATAGDFTVALKAIGQLAGLLSQAAEAAKAAQAAATPEQVAQEERTRLKLAWEQVVARYAPVVTSLEAAQAPQATQIRAAWDMALQAGQAGDFDKANLIMSRLRPLLDAAPKPSPSSARQTPDMAPGNTGAGNTGADPAPETGPAGGAPTDAPPETEPAAETGTETATAPEPASESPADPPAVAATAPTEAPQGAEAEPGPETAAEPKKAASPEVAAPLADSTDDPVKKQALQNIDKTRAVLLRVEGLIAAFGAPHPDDWDRAVQQADGLLSPAAEAAAADIEKAAKQAGTLLVDLEPKVKQLSLDKQTWQQQHPLFAARLEPIKAHALKAIDPVKSKLKALEDEIVAAEADAAQFEFKKAASGIVSFLARGDALEALADDFAHYRAIQQARATRVLPVRSKTSPRAPVQAAIDAVLAAYDDGVDKAGKDEFEAAVQLMNQVPALHDKMELMLDRAKKLDGDPAASYWVTKQGLLQAMQTYLTYFNSYPANVKALLSTGIARCQAALTANQPGVQPDLVKAAEALELAEREAGDLRKRGDNAKGYVALRGVFDAKLGDFKAHAGKAGIDDVITRMEADSASAATAAGQRKFDGATRILAASQGEWPAYKLRADDYLAYKPKRDALEARLEALRKEPQATAAVDELASCDLYLRQAATQAAARDYKSALGSVTAGDAAADVAQTLMTMRAEMAALKKDEVLAAVDKDVVAAFQNYAALEKYVEGKDDGSFAALRAAAAAEAQKGRDASLGASPDLDAVRAHLGAAITQLEAVLERVACKASFTSQRAAIKPVVETELKDGSAANDTCLDSDLLALTALLTAADDAVKAPGLDFGTGLAKVNEAQTAVAAARQKLALYAEAKALKALLGPIQTNLIQSRDAALTFTNPIDAKESLQIEIDKVIGFGSSFDTDWAAGKHAASLAKLKADVKRAQAYEASRADYVTAIKRRQKWIYDDEVNIAGDPLLQKERDEIAAAKVKIATLLQQRAFKAAAKVTNDDSFAIDRGKALLVARTAYEAKRQAAEAKVSEAEAETAKVASNVALSAQAVALRQRYSAAHGTTAVPTRAFETASGAMDKLAADCQPVIDAAKTYLLFETARAEAETRIAAVKTPENERVIAPMIARLDGKYANALELAGKGNLGQAQALVDVLPQDCVEALAAAKNNAALGEIGDSLDGLDGEDGAAVTAAVTKLRGVFDALSGEDAAEYAKGLAAVKAQVEALEAQVKTDPKAAKAAIPAALTSCEALQLEVSHHQQLSELANRVSTRITAKTAPFVKYSIIQEDAAALTAEVTAALQTARTGGDLAAASAAIETVMDKHHALLQMAARHDQLVQDCDALEAQHKALMGSAHRYAIRTDLERLAGYVVQARQAADGRDHDSGEDHVKTAQALALDASVKDKMAANQPPDPANIKAILDRPDGDAQLDEMIKGLDAAAQRRVLKVAFEAKYGCQLNIYANAGGGASARHAAGNIQAADTKKGPNLRRFYEVMSVLPPKDTRDNTSMKIFGYEDVKTQKGSVYSGGPKEVVMREGNAHLSGVYGFGRPHEVGVVDADCEPADQEQVDFFSWNTLHEAGHAVDDQRSFMTGVAGNAAYGDWQEHGGNVTPVAQAIAGHYGFAEATAYVAQYISDAGGTLAPPECPETVDPEVWEQRRRQVCAHVDMARAGNNPWASAAIAGKLNIGGRVYHESYDTGSWNSYAFAARKQAITGYQFRAPGEWFSELYAAYHSKKLKDQHPAVTWLKTLV